MTNWACSVCGTNESKLTMVQATILCLKCLDEIKKSTQQEGSGLGEALAVKIKENDIYE